MRLDRLRRGEVLAGAGAVTLTILLFAVRWYREPPARTGWQQLTSLRWLAVLTALAALALVFLQATRRAPALPVTMSVIVTVLGLVIVLWLIYRVLISPPTHRQAGAWLGLLGACLILLGGFWSMRQEGISPRDEPGEILTARLPRDRDVLR